MHSLSIIIPAYNEELRLRSTLTAIQSWASTRPWQFFEILVVDDGSQDSTARLVAEYSAQFTPLKLISNPGNRGKGYAVRNGMLNSKGAWCLFTDADLSSPIEEFAKLLDAALSTSADVAFGSRAINRTLVTIRQSPFREFSGRVFNIIVRLLTGLSHQDTQCGFKLYSATAARQIFRRQRLHGFGFDVEDLFLASLLGFRSVEVPVRWANVEGTRVGMVSGLRAFMDLVLIRLYAIRGCYK
ncbi:MAG: glycosyltransferase family 2 protein [Bryobacterales bacterium]|nr:glycosyltransferase family 2 protein [Bryobacterales bacterium]